MDVKLLPAMLQVLAFGGVKYWHPKIQRIPLLNRYSSQIILERLAESELFIGIC
jgi:hypothetical protein